MKEPKMIRIVSEQLSDDDAIEEQNVKGGVKRKLIA